MRAAVPADDYRNYHDLARVQSEDRHYRVQVTERPDSPVAILAPHGGRIEGGTSEVATRLAGEEHNLYLFEGLRPTGDNFAHLHLTSSRFDEPRCLGLIARCTTVLAIHGYDDDGPDVLLGGRDEALKSALEAAFVAAGVACLVSGHRFPGLDPRNVCNRGASGAGVQLELSRALRRSRDWDRVVRPVRAVLATRPASSP